MLIIPRVYRINIFPIKKKISTKFYLYLLRKIVRFFPIDITISISEGRNKQNLSRFIFKGYHTRIIDEKPGISRRKRNTLNIFWRHLSTFSLRLFHRRIFTTQDRFSREIIEASIWNVATGRYSAPKNGVPSFIFPLGRWSRVISRANAKFCVGATRRGDSSRGYVAR